ncbi:hypothetical protein [Cyclobacterium jeungdonense]|uniref:Glycosyl hydrolase-like 10 domain-containing protein n=1 Tax=Cyclobacterium jeungdonense TaxID=708087 RepID=A0ABT8C3W9_9BACT|nr:hypothetical protein [Cyclobacterium jeungdonense]MDN3687454.1 hypothetical protein [Cyclobacterium jeungdonense]
MNKLFWLLQLLIHCTAYSQEIYKGSFVKGIYGNPERILEAGYAFDELGVNAVFVRRSSLNQEFYQQAKAQGCRVFVEFPTLNGKGYIEDHPEAWPINEKGAPASPADWFMGVCPTDPGFQAFRAKQLRETLRNYPVDGVFLDYLHWHAQFETDQPVLPETCFCERCTRLFGKAHSIQIPGENKADRAKWILGNQEPAWREWRNEVLNTWVSDMGKILRENQPKALLGAFYCAWFPGDHGGALFNILGIDVPSLAERVDVLAPMLFHQMLARPVTWSGDYLDWLNNTIDSPEPLVWPIIQAHNKPGTVTPEEFGKALQEGSRAPASGIMMFSEQSLLENPEKIKVMQDYYQKKRP